MEASRRGGRGTVETPESQKLRRMRTLLRESTIDDADGKLAELVRIGHSIDGFVTIDLGLTV